MNTTNEIKSVSFCVTGAGAYATIAGTRAETTVRLPNGVKRVAQDLEDLADAEIVKADVATRRALTLRNAAAHVRASNAKAQPNESTQRTGAIRP